MKRVSGKIYLSTHFFGLQIFDTYGKDTLGKDRSGQFRSGHVRTKGGKLTQIFTFRYTTSRPVLSRAGRNDHETVHLGAGNCRVECCVM